MKKAHIQTLLGLTVIITLITEIGDLRAETTESNTEAQSTVEKNIKFPNGIPEHQNPGQKEEFFIPQAIDTQPDPSVNIGPGVIIGPNVYTRGKPIPNPLLRDVLPPGHPLLTNP